MAQFSNPEIKEALDSAANSIKQGDISRGRERLDWVLKKEPENALAWLWMSRCVNTRDEKLKCFYKVLATDPSNKHALDGIQRLGGTTPSNMPVANGMGDSGAASDLGTAKSGAMKWLVFAVLGIAVIIVGGVFASALLRPQQEPRTDVSTASAESQQLEDQVMKEVTILPLSEVDLDSLLLKSGDLPPVFAGQQIVSHPPPGIGSIPTAEKAVNQEFRTDPFGSEGITILLYESLSDVERAYQAVLKVISDDITATSVPQVGEKAMRSVEEMSGVQAAGVFIPPATVVKMIFTRCHALVYIDLFDTVANADVAAEYAKRVDQRLQPLVCP